jgi:hypothetical protein
MEVNKTILKKIIKNLEKGVKGNPDFASYVHQSGKYQTEINIGVQMVMFNRSYEKAVQMLIRELN